MIKGGQSMQGSQTRNIYVGRRVQAPAGSYRRPSAAQTARGKREKQRSRLERRRMLQVTVSAAILVIVVVVKLAMPDVLNRCRTQLLALMGEDTDFVAAFSAVGRAVSGDGSVGSALNDAYTAVFGPSHADDPAEEPANDPAQTGAEEETPPAEDGAPVYSSANTPAQVCLLQQQLGFAYAAPVAGEVTSAFGLRTHPLDGEERFHYGLDIGAEEGGVVTSFAAGTITAVGSSADLGEYVMVAHANGYTSLYAHCSRVTASSGQQVALGDPIAEVGQTGQTTGSHLHFELHQDTVYLNPIYYVQL